MESQQDKMRGALSYVFVLFFLALAKKDSAFCQFHGKQGMLLFLVWVLVSFVAWIPLIGWLAWMSMLIVNVIAIVKAFDGQMWEIPVLGAYAKKLNW